MICPGCGEGVPQEAWQWHTCCDGLLQADCCDMQVLHSLLGEAADDGNASQEAVEFLRIFANEGKDESLVVGRSEEVNAAVASSPEFLGGAEEGLQLPWQEQLGPKGSALNRDEAQEVSQRRASSPPSPILFPDNNTRFFQAESGADEEHEDKHNNPAAGYDCPATWAVPLPDGAGRDDNIVKVEGSEGELVPPFCYGVGAMPTAAPSCKHHTCLMPPPSACSDSALLLQQRAPQQQRLAILNPECTTEEDDRMKGKRKTRDRNSNTRLLSKQKREYLRRRGERLVMQMLENSIDSVRDQLSPCNPMHSLWGQRDSQEEEDSASLVREIGGEQVPISHKMRVCEKASKMMAELWRQVQENKAAAAAVTAATPPQQTKPQEMLIRLFATRVLSFLEAQSLSRGSAVSKEWKFCCETSSAWKASIVARWRLGQESLPVSHCAHWKGMYKSMHASREPPSDALAGGDVIVGNWASSDAIAWMIVSARSDQRTTRTVLSTPGGTRGACYRIATARDVVDLKVIVQALSSKYVHVPEQEFQVVRTGVDGTESFMASVGSEDSRFASTFLHSTSQGGTAEKKWIPSPLRTYDYATLSLFIEVPGCKTYDDFFSLIASYPHSLRMDLLICGLGRCQVSLPFVESRATTQMMGTAAIAQTEKRHS